MKDRYKDFRGYKFDRLIFQISMAAVFIFLFYVAYSHSFNLDYFHCPLLADGSLDSSSWLMTRNFEQENTQGYCKNPFYKPQNWKNMEYLPPGDYGTKPGLLFRSMYLVVGLILALGFVVNHLIYNKKFDFKKLKVEN